MANIALAQRILKLLLVLAGTCLVFLFIWCVAHRIAYPYELYWEEGLSADHVQRVMEGQKLYVEPSVQFVPFIYTPLFFYISAAVAKVVGFGLLPLRLVSIGATIGTTILIFIWIKREMGTHLQAFITASLFLGFYPTALTFYDVGKPDIAFVFFGIAAYYVLRFSENRASILVSSVLFLLSFLTKQAALFFIAPALLYVMVSNKKYKWLFIALTCSLIVASILILNQATGGWFNFYIFDLPASQPLRVNSVWFFWRYNILQKYALILFLNLAVLYIYAHEKKWQHLFFWAAFFSGMILCSWLSLIHGGDANVLIPVYAAMAVVLGVSLVSANVKLRSPWLRFLLSGCILFQMLTMIYKPGSLIPDIKNRADADRIMNELKSETGEIWFMYHGYYNHLLGKPMDANESSLTGILDATSDWSYLMEVKIERAIESRKYATIIMDRPWLQDELEKFYDKEEIRYDNPEGFMPVCGWRTRPLYIFRLKKE